jgi:predicted MFS family arabinose efflux permease
LFTSTLLRSRPASPSERRSFIEGVSAILSKPGPRARILELFTYVLSFATLTGGLALFLERRLSFDVQEVGYAFAFSGLIGALVQGGIGRAARRLGERGLSAAGIGLMVVGYGVLAASYTVTWMGVGLAIGSLGSAVVRPALTTLLTGSVPESDRGLVLGVSQSASSLGQTIGPAVAGWIIHRGALAAWAIVAAVFAASALAIRWLSSHSSV